jgi:hypothetical protein
MMQKETLSIGNEEGVENNFAIKRYSDRIYFS